MATQIESYDALNELLLNASLDLETATIRVALITSGYTFASTHAGFTADIEPNELPTAGNYTAGGELLTTSSVGLVGGVAYWTADNVSWPNLTATFEYAVIYAVGTIGGYTNPPLIYIWFDDGGGGVSVTSFDFAINWNVSGIMSLDAAV